MARFFDDSDDVIRWSIGAMTGQALGPVTVAAIIKRGSDTGFDSILGLHTSGGTNTFFFQVQPDDRLVLGGSAGMGDSGATLTVVAADGWVFVAANKATGTVAPRFHKYVYSTGAAMSHVNSASTAANGSSPGAGGYAELSWQGGDLFHGDIAVVALWPSSLADDQIESMPYSLDAWFCAQPSALWLLDQSAIAQAVPDLSGNGSNQSSITGTTVSTSSVPVFGYGATGGLWSVESAAAQPAAAPLPDPFRRRLPLLVR